jgi:dTDP-4-dehydrorhamnose reductase
LIINTAAMTDVDGCTRDPAAAYRANGLGPQNIALAAAASGAEVLHISTNEVFDGAATQPYCEWQPRQSHQRLWTLQTGGRVYTEQLLTRFYIVRTAWLYAAEGRNFPHRMIQLADERERLRVVTDEIANPTYVVDLAAAIVQLIQTHAYGLYHLVNAGTASRYEFAQAIMALSGRKHILLEPITSAEFQRPARRLSMFLWRTTQRRR